MTPYDGEVIECFKELNQENQESSLYSNIGINYENAFNENNEDNIPENSK